MDTAEQLAGLIMDADLPKRLEAENAKLRLALEKIRNWIGKQEPDRLPDDVAGGLWDMEKVARHALGHVPPDASRG